MQTKKSDESKAKAVSEHAEVKQEHRREAKRFCDAVDFLEEDELAQFLADHDAEVERQVLERCCKWHDNNCASGMSARMRAELGGTNV